MGKKKMLSFSLLHILTHYWHTHNHILETNCSTATTSNKQQQKKNNTADSPKREKKIEIEKKTCSKERKKYRRI